MKIDEKLAIIIPHLNFSGINDLLNDIEGQQGIEYHVFLINSGNLEIEKQFSKRINLTSFYFEKNQGVARAWNIGLNKAIESGYRNFLWLNDDLRLENVDVLCNTMMGIREGFCVTTTPEGMWGWFFGYNYDAFLRIGEFDERFYPCFFEDNDISDRLKEIKILFREISGISHLGSQTAKDFQEYKASNRLIYQAKKNYYERT